MISIICQSEGKRGAAQPRKFCRFQRKDVFKHVFSGLPVGIAGEREVSDQSERLGRGLGGEQKKWRRWLAFLLEFVSTIPNRHLK